jgi:Bacterial protein of unknown function (DUF916)
MGVAGLLAAAVIATQIATSVGAFGVGGSGLRGSLGAASGPPEPQTRKNISTFGIQPATRTAPDALGYFDFGATPGGVILDYVAVINYSLKPLTLGIKSSDALITSAGGFALQPPNHPVTQLGSWVHLPKTLSSVTVPARSFEIVPFTVTVPKNASPGDHAGGILATLQSFVESKSGQRIKLLQSVGARIFLRVSGPLHPGLTISNLQVHYTNPVSPLESGRAKITYTVADTGNVALGGRQSVWISGLFGTKRYAAKVPEVQLLLPGYSVRETAVVSGILPEVWERAHVSITPLVIPGSVQPKSGPFTASKGFWAVPWVLIAVVIAALALVGSVVRRRRRRRMKPSGGLGDPATSPNSTAHTTTGNGSRAPEVEPSLTGATSATRVETAVPEEARNEG